jgi:hypothetical protein
MLRISAQLVGFKEEASLVAEQFWLNDKHF